MEIIGLAEGWTQWRMSVNAVIDQIQYLSNPCTVFDVFTLQHLTIVLQLSPTCFNPVVHWLDKYGI